MRNKKSVLLIIAVVLTLSVICCIGAEAASIFFYETQFTYNKSIPSWLMNLSVYDNMTTLEGFITSLIKPCTIVPIPGSYKYSKTHEAFAEEVNKLVGIFSLDEQGEDAQKAVYMYVLGLLDDFSDAYMVDVTDEQIRTQLVAAGIIFPAEKDMTSEHFLFARVLYKVLTTSPDTLTIPKGTTLESAFIMLLSKLVDVDTSSIDIDISNASLETVEQYTTEIAKIALKTRGYNLPNDATNNEIYRILAVMVIGTTGTTVDADNMTFSELKMNYLASTLGLTYDVTLNPNALKTAVANGNVPFYILQAIANQYKLTIRNDLSYEDAFMRVAENTNYFALSNEFYADIYEYNIYLDYKCDKAWIYPTALNKTDTAKKQTVTITIDGKTVEDTYPTEIALDKTKVSQSFTVSVKYQQASAISTSTYKINIHQGDTEAPVKENPSQANNTEATTENNTSDNSLGFLGTIGSLPSKLNNIVSLIVPGFTGVEPTGYNYMASLLGMANGGSNGKKSDDGTLGGIGGIDISAGAANSSSPLSPSFNSNNYYGGGTGGDTVDSQTNNGGNVSSANPSLSHIDTMEPAPAGYSYITDSQGYVLGLSIAHEQNNFVPVSKNIQMTSLIKDNVVLFTFLLLSLAGIGIAIIWKVKFRRTVR